MILEDFPRISDCDWELNKTFELQPIQGALKDATFLDYDSWQNFLMVGDFEHKALVYKLDGEGNTLETIPVEGERVYTTFDTIGRIYSCATTPDFSTLIIGGGDISDSTIGFAKWYTIDEDQHIEFANELYMDNNNTPFDGRVTKVVISPHGQYAILIGNFTGYAKLYTISPEGVLYLTDVPLDDEGTPLDGAVQDAAFFPGRTADNYFLVGGAFTGKLIRCRYVSNHWASNKVLDFNNTVNAIIFSKRKVSGSAYGLAIGGAFDGYAFYYLTTNSGVSYTLKAQVYDSGNVPLSSPVISGASCYGEDIFVLNSSSDTLVERKGRVYGFTSSQVNYISDYLTGSIIWDVKFSSDNTKLIASCDTGVYIYGLGDGSTVTISDSNRYQITQEMSYPMCGDFTDFGSKMIIGGDALKEFDTGVAYTGIREVYRHDGAIRGETFKFNSTGRYGIKYTQGRSLLQVYWFDENGEIISIDDWDQAGTAYNGVIQGAFFDPTEKVIFVYGGNEGNNTGFMYTLMRKNGADNYTFATSNSYQAPVRLVEASPYIDSYSDHPMYHIVVAVGYYMIREGVAVYEDTVGYGNFSDIETSNPGTPIKIVFSPNNEYIAVLYGVGASSPPTRLYDYSTFLCSISAGRQFNNCAFLNNNTQIVLWFDYSGIRTDMLAGVPLLYSINHSTTNTKCTYVMGIGEEIFGASGLQLATVVDESRNLIYCVLGQRQTSGYDIRAVAYLINTDNTCTYLYDFYDGKNDEAFEYGNYTGLPKNLYLSQDKKTLTLGKFVYPLNIPTTESIHIANIYDITDEGVVFRSSVPNSELLPAMTQVNCQALAENKVGLTAFGINSSSSIPSYGQIIVPVWDNSIVTQEEIYADNGTLELQGSLSRCKYFENNGYKYAIIAGDFERTRGNVGGSLFRVLEDKTLEFVCDIPLDDTHSDWNGESIVQFDINQCGDFLVVRSNTYMRYYNFDRDWTAGIINNVCYLGKRAIDSAELNSNFSVFEKPNGYNSIYLSKDGYDVSCLDNTEIYQWTPFRMSGNWINHIYYDVIQGDRMYIAVGAGGYIAYSINGMLWATITSFSSTFSDFYGVAYSSSLGRYVAIGVVSGGSSVVYSADGANWTKADVTLAGGYRTITYHKGIFCAAGYSGYIAYSEDGINWTELTPSESGSFESSYCMTTGKGYVVALGGDIKYSYNGKSWTTLTNPTGASITGVAYGNGKFIGVSTYGNYVYSYNGSQWFQNSYHGVDGILEKIVFGRGRFVARTMTGKIYESIDGEYWRPQTTRLMRSKLGSSKLECIAYDSDPEDENGSFFGIAYEGPWGYNPSVEHSMNIVDRGVFFNKDIVPDPTPSVYGAKLGVYTYSMDLLYPTDQSNNLLVINHFCKTQTMGGVQGLALFKLSESNLPTFLSWTESSVNDPLCCGNNNSGALVTYSSRYSTTSKNWYKVDTSVTPEILVDQGDISGSVSSVTPFNVFNRSGDGLLIGHNGEPQIYKANSDASSYTYVNSIYDALPKGWSFTSSSAIYSGIDLPDNESTVSIQVKYKNLTSNPWVDILTSVNYDDTSKELKIKLSPSKFLTLFTNCDIKFKFYNS